jgi:hypothetical protein
MTAAFFSTVAAFALGVNLSSIAAEQSTNPRAFSWIEERVRALQPTAKEKRFDEIGWASDIRSAEKLARENNRPVFLFTHDGRMNIGRC